MLQLCASCLTPDIMTMIMIVKKTNIKNKQERMMFSNYPDIVGIGDIQKMLKIGRNKVYELLKNGEIKSIRIGNKYIIPKKCVINFILQRLQ